MRLKSSKLIAFLSVSFPTDSRNSLFSDSVLNTTEITPFVSVIELYLCNCIAIAFQLLCNCNANYASLSCLVLSCQLTSCLVISKNKYLWNTTVIRVFLSLCSFLSFY